MSTPGKILMITGGLVFLTGVLLTLGIRLPFIGRLPGDIYIQKEHFSFYIPITTSIVISLALTFLFALFRHR